MLANDDKDDSVTKETVVPLIKVGNLLNDFEVLALQRRGERSDAVTELDDVSCLGSVKGQLLQGDFDEIHANRPHLRRCHQVATVDTAKDRKEITT